VSFQSVHSNYHCLVWRPHAPKNLKILVTFNDVYTKFEFDCMHC
jgi:hypothetical protein